MNEKELAFPIYRKYVGINTWFKIEDEKNFIEVKQLGKKYIMHQLEATQYPEMSLIQDMIACYENRWEVIEEDAFNTILEKVES